MPQVASKPKKLPVRMTDNLHKRVGRVFCVTGMSPNLDPASPPTLTQCCDTESNSSHSSGYLSSSSFESSSEERRLGLTEQKVFQVWEGWSQQRDQPRNSTPKNANTTHKGCLNLSPELRKSALSIKKNIGTKQHENEPVGEKDSFWDIVTPQLFKSRSENDMRGENRIRSVNMDIKRDLFRGDSGKRLGKHDAGSIPNLSTRRGSSSSSSGSDDWKRRPYQTRSTSDQDLRLSGNTSSVSRTSDSTVSSGYQSLPRYRVVVGESQPTKSRDMSKSSSSGELVNKLSRSCADFMDSGKPVDESMTEFLANVDQDNLASFLNFYDKVTSSAAYEKARRNPKNYEAVYY